MNLPALVPPPELPCAGARVPGFAPRVALVLAAALLSLVDFGATAWLGVGVALGMAAAAAPRTFAGWWLILFLALGRIGHAAALDWSLFVLLAGVHLLHVLAMLTLELPWRGWVQPRALLAPLRRFAVIQVPAQILAVVALLVLAPGQGGHRPLVLAAFSLVGALALAGAGWLLFGRRPA
jgi:hypothetical protein